MNLETGAVYRDQVSIDAAKARGENVVPVSERVADAVEIGMQALNRAERRLRARAAKPKARTKSHVPKW